MEKKVSQRGVKIVVWAQVMFLTISIMLSLFWWQEYARAGKPFLPFFAFLFLCGTAGVFRANVKKRKYTVQSLCYVYGAIVFVIFLLTVLLLVQPHIDIVPSITPFLHLVKRFDIGSLYWAIFEILPILLILAILMGICAICMMMKRRRPTEG